MRPRTATLLCCGLLALASVPSAVAQSPSPFGVRTLFTGPPKVWSPVDWAPLASEYDMFHPQVFTYSQLDKEEVKPALAIAIDEFDAHPGPDIIALHRDGTLTLSRNWELNVGEPVPPRELPVRIPRFVWSATVPGYGVYMQPLQLDPNSDRRDLAILTQVPPQLFVVRNAAVSGPRIDWIPIPSIPPSRLRIADTNHDSIDEIFFLQNQQIPNTPIWLRSLHFTFYDSVQNTFLSGGYPFGPSVAPLVDFAIGDLDRNLLLDVVLAEERSFEIYHQYPNRGLVHDFTSYFLPEEVLGLEVGDLDGDGLPDFVVRHRDSVEAFFRASLLRRSTSPDVKVDTGFASWIHPRSSSRPVITDLKLADLDGDGRSDFLLSLERNMCFVAWKMGSNGALAPLAGRGIYGYFDRNQLPATPPRVLYPNPGGAIVVRDFDFDGDPDAFLLNPELGAFFRMTNRARHEAPEIEQTWIVPDPASANPLLPVDIVVQYKPHANFQSQLFVMAFHVFEQRDGVLNPIPVASKVTPVFSASTTPPTLLETLSIPHEAWARSSNLALLISHDHLGLIRTAATVLIPGGHPTGVPNSGNGTTSCARQNERIVWEPDFAPTCKIDRNTTIDRP